VFIRVSLLRTPFANVIPLLGAQRVPESIFRSSQKYCLCRAGFLRTRDDDGRAACAAKTGSRNLCLAGGVALNSKANGKIAASGFVEKLFVQPAASDDALHWVPRSLRIWIRTGSFPAKR